jgi:protein-S-isoprenylcysteine O-methyltransferase Ste14
MLGKIISFTIATIILIYISRASLLHPRSHGFTRFFAWEVLLALFFLNVNYWFVHPFAWYQIIAWILLFASIVPVVWGTVLLQQRGKPVERRAGDPSLLAFEKTTSLVTTGIYKTIRHPLYSSLLLLAWGIFFKSPSWSGGGLAAAASALLYVTARLDEAECIKFFGAAYEDYMNKTKRFIPFVF